MRIAYLVALLAFSVAVPGQTPAAKLSLPLKTNDAKVIARGIIMSPSRKAKGEFETTAEYETRKNSIRTAALADGSQGDAVLKFKLGSTKSLRDGVSATYNADEQSMNISLDVTEFDDIVNATGQMYAVPLTAPEYQDLGTYVGSNSFGTKREISKSQLTYFRLIVKNIEAFNLNRGRSRRLILADIKMPTAVAQLAKPNIAVLYTVKLAAPYLGLGFFDKKPTVDSPSEIKSITYYLYSNVDEIVVFNEATGEVYATIKAQQKTMQ